MRSSVGNELRKFSLIDVMEKIDKYIIPCFRRVAEKHGYSFD